MHLLAKLRQVLPSASLLMPTSVVVASLLPEVAPTVEPYENRSKPPPLFESCAPWFSSTISMWLKYHILESSALLAWLTATRSGMVSSSSHTCFTTLLATDRCGAASWFTGAALM